MIYKNPYNSFPYPCGLLGEAGGRCHGTLDWEGDTDGIRHFKLPEAERFSRAFCNTCGGPLHISVPKAGFAFVPAGTLDDEPNIRPQARIFLESKTACSCGAEELPGFPDYPQ